MQLAHFMMFMLCAKVRGGVKKGKEKRAPKARMIFLVAPQGTTGYENKGDMLFSTVFPKPFPTREIRMCIPICCTLRRTSQDRFSSPIREGNFTCLRRFGRGIEPRLAPDRNQRPRRGPTVWLLMEVGAMSDTTA